MCLQLRNFLKRKQRQRDRLKLHTKVNHLYAFDFDHTMIRENSDVAVTNLLGEPIPPEIHKIYDGSNWIEYMDSVLKYLASKNITTDEIKRYIRDLEFVLGMEDLLQRIRKTREKDPSNHFIVISDANDFFIETAMSKIIPNVEPNKVFTNRALLPPTKTGKRKHGYIKLRPFEEQKECKICPRNLCKGKALTKYLMTQGPFTHTYYIGDGLNDVCPALYLGPSDTLYARRGFTLEKIIREKRLGSHEIMFNCNIVFWDTGDDIQNHMEFITNQKITWPKLSEYVD